MSGGVVDSAQQSWTVKRMLQWAIDDFRARGIENPRLDAEVLLSFATGLTRVQLIVDSERPLEPGELSRFRDCVKRRRAFEPVAYLRGEREFYGRNFRVDARVLVPRPDTETLVRVALERVNDIAMQFDALDMCTGSGCVAITLARECPTARVHGADISADALAVAQENALRLGAYNVSFAVSDLFANIATGQHYDIITANAPYIPTAEIATLAPDVRNYEPTLALDGGSDGLDIVRRIVDAAPGHLTDGGILALEIMAGQAPETASIMKSRGFSDVVATRDYGNIERVVHGIFRK